MPKWGKVAIIVVGTVVGAAILLVLGIYVWFAVTYENAQESAEEAPTEVAASIAARLSHSQSDRDTVDTIGRNGGILIRQKQEPEKLTFIVRVRAIHTGFGGGPIQNEHCYEFVVPTSSQRKVTYTRIHLDRCVDWVVPKGTAAADH